MHEPRLPHPFHAGSRFSRGQGIPRGPLPAAVPVRPAGPCGFKPAAVIARLPDQQRARLAPAVCKLRIIAPSAPK